MKHFPGMKCLCFLRQGPGLKDDFFSDYFRRLRLYQFLDTDGIYDQSLDGIFISTQPTQELSKLVV
jgi:hypothetical protein